MNISHNTSIVQLQIQSKMADGVDAIKLFLLQVQLICGGEVAEQELCLPLNRFSLVLAVVLRVAAVQRPDAWSVMVAMKSESRVRCWDRQGQAAFRCCQ